MMIATISVVPDILLEPVEDYGNRSDLTVEYVDSIVEGEKVVSTQWNEILYVSVSEPPYIFATGRGESHTSRSI